VRAPHRRPSNPAARSRAPTLPRSTLADPYLNAFRGLLPPLGQIDLSPILAFTVLNVFQGAAAALPAEQGRRRARGGGAAAVARMLRLPALAPRRAAAEAA
jgi:hypothetical protein